MDPQLFKEKGYPVVSYCRRRFAKALHADDMYSVISAVSEIFDPKKFISPKYSLWKGYSSRTKELYVFYSPKDTPHLFKMARISPDFLEQDIQNFMKVMTNPRIPEGDEILTVDFWEDFYDCLPEDNQEKYPIPDPISRELFYTNPSTPPSS